MILGARDLGKGTAAAAALAADGLDASAQLLDVTDQAGIIAAAERIGEQHGRVDVLVNNAAIT